VYLTQPSLSRLIHRMEDRLEQPLFERTTRGMVLTVPGELLLRHARHLLADMDSLRDELAAHRGVQRGVVRIGAVASVMRTVVAAAVGRMIEGRPTLRFEAREAVNSLLVQQLDLREIDLAVTADKIDDDAIRAIGRCGYTDSFAVFGASDHPLLRGAPTLRELFAEGWVMPGIGYTPRIRFEALVRQLGYHVCVSVETDTVETMIAISAASQLLCWLPLPIAAPAVAQGLIRRLPTPSLEIDRQFWVYCRRNGILPDAAREFVRHLPLVAEG